MDHSPRRTLVRYAHYTSAWRFKEYVENFILGSGVKTICEVGAGANPVLGLSFVERHSLSYVILDISHNELAKVDDGYAKVTADITAKDFVAPGRYELVFSRMLAEHVEDAEAFHRNVYSLLVEDGIALHFFPTMYSLPFVANRVLPEAVSEWIIRLGWSHRTRESKSPKFPARYRWCHGPTRKQIERLERIGYDVEEYVGFFGHGYYNRLGLVRAVSERLTGHVLAHPLPQWTSYAYVTLRRPKASR